MRDEKAQMSVDFLTGMTLFAGVLFFVFQFMSGTILPFAISADEKAVTVDRTGDKIYYDRLVTEEKGVIDNITYFWDSSSNSVVDENQVLNDVGVDPDRHGLNITVINETINDEEIVEINGTGLTDTGPREELKIGGSPPDEGVSVNRATRIGYVTETEQEPETVVIKMRMW